MESAGTIVVDWTLCEAHGLCTSVLPEVISLEADGFPAAASCPSRRSCSSRPPARSTGARRWP
ncbi:ferredoxin [Kitasatospora arboriphila]